jgi:hypothetical protein
MGKILGQTLKKERGMRSLSLTKIVKALEVGVACPPLEG